MEESTHNYVYFGMYPQSLKEDRVTISTNEKDIIYCGFHTDARQGENKIETYQLPTKYYLGSDGAYYEKIKSYKYLNAKKFSNDTYIWPEKEYYFRVEPIKWRVLEIDKNTNSTLLMCDSIIDAHAFDNTRIYPEFIQYKYEKGSYYDEKDSGNNNYAHSSIRKFLNNEFITRAFTEYERSLIVTSPVYNSYVKNKFACEDTVDKVFLLSKDELTNPKFGFVNNEYTPDVNKQLVPTDFSRAMRVYTNDNRLYSKSDLYRDNGIWWTRTPHKLDEKATDKASANIPFVNLVNYNGAITYYFSTQQKYGVVPAIRVSLKELNNYLNQRKK